jgi:hypothetical protein
MRDGLSWRLGHKVAKFQQVNKRSAPTAALILCGGNAELGTTTSTLAPNRRAVLPVVESGWTSRSKANGAVPHLLELWLSAHLARWQPKCCRKNSIDAL